MQYQIFLFGFVATSLAVASPFRPPPTTDLNPFCTESTEICFGPGPILPRSEGFYDKSTAHVSRSKVENKEPSTTESDHKPQKDYMKLTSLGDIPVGSFKIPKIRAKGGASFRKPAPKTARSLEQVKDMARLERKIARDRKAKLAQRELEEAEQRTPSLIKVALDGANNPDAKNGEPATALHGGITRRDASEQKAPGTIKVALDGANNPESKTGEPATAIHDGIAKRYARSTLELNKHHADLEASGREELIQRLILDDQRERHARLDHREKVKIARALGKHGKDSEHKSPAADTHHDKHNKTAAQIPNETNALNETVSSPRGDHLDKVHHERSPLSHVESKLSKAAHEVSKKESHKSRHSKHPHLAAPGGPDCHWIHAKKYWKNSCKLTEEELKQAEKEEKLDGHSNNFLRILSLIF